MLSSKSSAQGIAPAGLELARVLLVSGSAGSPCAALFRRAFLGYPDDWW